MHLFDFQIDADFFQLFEASPVQDGHFQVRLYFDKKPDLFVLVFDFAGYVVTDCDRCLEPIQLPVSGREQLIVKITELELEEEADVIYLSSYAHELNVAKYMYEFICLAIPMHRVYDCGQDAQAPCNRDILKFISGSTDQASEPPAADAENPLWSALKDQFKEEN